MADLGVPNYDELVIVASSARLKSDPAYARRVSAFLAGLRRGIAGAIRDPKGAVAIVEQDTKYKASEVEAMVPPTLRAMAETHGAKLGCLERSQWRRFASFLLRHELVRRRIPAAAVETNRYNRGC
jgi:putative hydroxymethylpyrimidine transport system substrate-binding protein